MGYHIGLMRECLFNEKDYNWHFKEKLAFSFQWIN